jgi:hypothetical protein
MSVHFPTSRHPASRKPFPAIKGLLLGYLGIGIAALVVVILLRNHPAEVNAAAWVRSVIVVATALILLSAATLAGPTGRSRPRPRPGPNHPPERAAQPRTPGSGWAARPRTPVPR